MHASTLIEPLLHITILMIDAQCAKGQRGHAPARCLLVASLMLIALTLSHLPTKRALAHQMLGIPIPLLDASYAFTLLSLERSAVLETPNPAPFATALTPQYETTSLREKSQRFKCTFSINVKKHIVSSN